MVLGEKMAKKVYAYFLEEDFEQGVLDTWQACQEKIKGKKARYKSFPNALEAEKWLLDGAKYESKEEKQEKKRKKQATLEDGIYFDAGTGRGIGVEVRVTDRRGESYLTKHYPDLCNEFGNIPLGFSKTNNYGELYALGLALEIAKREQKEEIYGDSHLVIAYWSQGRFHAENLGAQTLRLIQRVMEKRKEFEREGGKIIHISGDDNPADLGFHK